MQRQRISSGTPWEARVGYSRAVRVDNRVFVTGTIAAREDGRIEHPGDPYLQTLRVIEKIETALLEAGARLEDVVRTRMFVVNIAQWEEIGRAHAERFGHVCPATTMVEVSRLIAPDALIEIEADAIIGPAEATT